VAVASAGQYIIGTLIQSHSHASTSSLIFQAPFTRYNLLSNRLTTGLTNGCIVYTASCQTGCTTRFDNQLNEQCLLVQHGCQTGFMFVYTTQPVVKPVVQPVVSCKRSFRGWMLFLIPNQQCQRTDSNTAITASQLIIT